jgi:adenylate cyclase
VSAVSFGTRRPSGFSAVEQALLRRVVPALRGAVATALLDTYVGSATGRRILSGHIRRGDVESLEAALMFCDLHDFTALSNRLPSERVLALLNIYYDQVVPAIGERGGEVLKFLGDGVLAFFHDYGGPAPSCAAAFEAARLVCERLAQVCLPDAKLRAGIALHFGEVSYGNIGAGDRLDFTVIGRDVNLTSRIQGLCGAANQSLLMSERFAHLLDRPGTAPIGRYELKGFAEPAALFAWLDPAH